MRIVSWNCCRGPIEKKLDALDTLAADIAILCEAPTPRGEPRGLWFPSGVSSLGTQVIAANGYSIEKLPSDDLAPCVNPVRVIGPVSFTLLAVWTWPAPTYVKAFNAGLQAYEPLMRSTPTVVAGDFNGNPTYDKPRQWVKWSDSFTALEGLGLLSAYHEHRNVGFGQEAEPTHHYLRREGSPFHIDFCFVPKAWSSRGLAVKIEAGAEWRKLSDHFPLIVDVSSA